MERDYAFTIGEDGIFISTHTLTWSVTCSADILIEAKDFNSHAHVERDLSA